MKKVLFTLLTVLSLNITYAQWEVCYEQGTVFLENTYWNGTTGCYELCDNLPNPSWCYTGNPNPVPADLPIVCHDHIYTSNIYTTVDIFFDYNLACGNYTLPAWLYYEDLWTTCWTLDCTDGYMPTPGCLDISNTSINNSVNINTPPKRLVSYKLKDACSGGGDTGGGGLSSDCECPDFAIYVNGTMYVDPFSGSSASSGGGGVTYMTPIPTAGGKHLSIFVSSGPGTGSIVFGEY